MKKNISILLVLAALIFTSCGNNAPSSSQTSNENSNLINSETSNDNGSSQNSSSTNPSENTNSSEKPGSESSQNSGGGSSSEGSSNNNSSESSNNSEGTSNESSQNSSGNESSNPKPIEEDRDPEKETSLGKWYGIGIKQVAVGHYFDALKNVRLITTEGVDITDYINVVGSVDYGKIGKYELTYKVNFNGKTDNIVRNIEVANVAHTPYVKTKTQGVDRTQEMGKGSYRTGNAGQTKHFRRPLYQPAFVDDEIADRPLPTNGWWTTLIGQNYGGGNYNGGGNGIYLNPLRSSLGTKGIELSDVTSPWTQWGAAGVNQNEKTAHHFSTFFQDILYKPTSLNDNYVSSVIDYTDNNVKVALRNTKAGQDEAVVTYTQGSPYVFTEYNKKEIAMEFTQGGVTQGYYYYDINGNPLGDSYTGDSFVIEFRQRHTGYITSPTHQLGAGLGPNYKNAFYLVNLPKNSTVSFFNQNHSQLTWKNAAKITLGDGNYMSIGILNSLIDANFYHNNGYAMMSKANTNYHVNHDNNFVTTNFRNNLVHLNGVESSNGLLAIMPHHQRISNLTYTGKTFGGTRGTLRVMEGNAFTTTARFSGVLPSYTLPQNEDFDQTTMRSYLNDLDSRTVYDNVDDSTPATGTDFIDSVVPYWNAKAIYPLSQAVIIADQMGESTLKASFLDKIKNSLVDWFTYEGGNDDRFIFYDETWGTTIYSNNEFNTGAELSDHHFTHGYLIFASAVVSMYDKAFYNDYKDIITFFLSDYASPTENDYYPELRTFDKWTGHSWAHGYGFFTDGNNQESSGEALNSWVAAYMIGLQNNDTELVDAAIYGYTSELNSIKTYWFDYDENVFEKNYLNFTHVAGIVFGGKYDYATWFGANPTFIYGIHWLPTGEYNSSYVLGSSEKATFKKIFNKYLQLAGGQPNTWYSNIWAMQSLVDSSDTLNEWDANKIKKDDYPNELAFTYYMINAMDHLLMHSADSYMSINSTTSSSVYETSNGLVAMVWNPTNKEQSVTFKTKDNTIKTIKVPASSFTSHNL